MCGIEHCIDGTGVEALALRHPHKQAACCPAHKSCGSTQCARNEAASTRSSLTYDGLRPPAVAAVAEAVLPAGSLRNVGCASETVALDSPAPV